MFYSTPEITSINVVTQEEGLVLDDFALVAYRLGDDGSRDNYGIAQVIEVHEERTMLKYINTEDRIETEAGDETGLFEISSDMIICFIPHNLESQSELEEYIDNILTGSDERNEYEYDSDDDDRDYRVDDNDEDGDDDDEKGDGDED